MFTCKQAREALKAKKWTYRAAAPALGVNFTHLALVLSGARVSQTLLDRIEVLVNTKEAASKAVKVPALATNASPRMALSTGLSVNVASIVRKEEWHPLAEYGKTDLWRMEEGQPKLYLQSFTREQAGKMALALNARLASEGFNFRGLSVCVGRADIDPNQWVDNQRFGGVMALEARTEGLFAKIAWNDLGEKNRAERYYIYPFPVWQYDEAEARSSRVIRPTQLQLVGLTNQIPAGASKPWTNSRADGFPPGSPVGMLPVVHNLEFDLSTPEGRQRAFDSELARLKAEGITDLDKAITHMRTTKEGKALIAAMHGAFEKAEGERRYV